MRSPPRGAPRIALAWIALAAGCTGYEGSRPNVDASVDTPRDSASDAVDDRVDAPAEPVAAREVCGAYGLVCDPLTDDGCASGLACVVTTLLPPTASCVTPGARPLGASCDARLPSMRCSAGLQCLSGRCLRPCCARDDARCAEADARSACAVFTESETLYGCTLAGACSYRPQSQCPAGSQCFPQTEFGEAICRPVGGNPDGARCVDQNDCAAGSTCLIFGTGAGVGACRPACNPRDAVRCAASACVRMLNRPADFGACEGR